MDTIGGTAATAAVLTGSMTSRLDAYGDHDWFKVTLQANTTYLLKVDGYQYSTLKDPAMMLYDANGSTPLAYNDDANGTTHNALIRYTPSTTGTFYIDVSASNNAATGFYTVSAELAPPLPIYSLDEIADYLTYGFWASRGARHFAADVITYTVQDLKPAEQELARTALQAWQDVGNFTFHEITGKDAMITFWNDGTDKAQTSGTSASADVYISSDWDSGTTAFYSYKYQTYLHEIGHALGLGHGGPYDGTATYGQDNIYENDSWATSVMSYFTQAEAGVGSQQYVMTPQIADILALADLYGPTPNFHQFDTTYGYNSNAGTFYNFASSIYNGVAPAYTVYDTGGTDTLDGSGASANEVIDLRAEHWSSMGGAQGNIGIARDSIIENGYGGSGNDELIGNDGDNILSGNAGNDVASGGGGNDTIYGGDGADTLNGGAGNDILIGDTDPFAGNKDVFDGGEGDDVIYGERTDDVQGGAGHDALLAVNANDWTIDIGNASIETMIADFGNDNIDATTAAGSVEVVAGGGDDTVTGGAFDDRLWGGVGNDTLSGGTGDDMLFGDVGADHLSGDDGNDILYIDPSDPLVDGGAGNDVAYIATGTGITLDMAATSIEFVIDLAGGNNTITAAGATTAVSVYTGAGNDDIVGSANGDVLWGMAGNDAIDGAGGDDVIVGGTGADVLTPGAGVDAIYANSGNGGDGAVDRIVLAAGWGSDVVNDFEHGIDKIDMTALHTSFAALSITSAGGNAIVHLGADALTVAGLAGHLTAVDFLF